MGWREAISNIRELIATTSPKSWRADLNAISPNSTSWRSAISLWADNVGVSGKNGREKLIGIAHALGATGINNRREALQWIAENYSPAPPAIWNDGRTWNDNETWRDREAT